MSHTGDANLPVPYYSRLGQPLEAGQTLNIHGKINDGAQGAEINLLRGGNEITPETSVILHLKFNFKDKKVVLNSYENSTWGKEVRESIPFHAGEDYDLRIRVLDEALEISANGKKIVDFAHRIPFNTIENLAVKGDLSISGLHWGGRFYKLPWETGFPGGHLQNGQKINIYAIPRGDRFSFDLIARNQDILFHFNPRIKEKVIVRNSHRNGFWDKEEREGASNLQKDVGFDLSIINEEYSIQIFINGERFGTFQHRAQNPIGDYIGMRIDGEVEVTSIDYSA
ncbi:unnamed protein product [Caenorhabditis angaria]|uniref:Galectin n=1 Tax=Caenorhabditis angaria TaxID=860376 RepID=A0A9P1N0A1_9PELO|nr:unnamed protein product [Caenorhabditis angaria]